MENENSHLNKQTTNEDVGEDKAAFYRNLQVQKLFNDYNYDRDKLKKDDTQVIKPDPSNKIENPTASGSDKTTKFTTINTIPKN
jgi:hypothetical protein